MVFAGMRVSLAYFLITLFASFCAEGQPRTELIAGAEWEFPGLAGPIAALQAPLGKPNSLALANNGDLLIADVGNNIVLRLSADGTLRVVAGNGAQAYSGDGGPATAASLINPAAIAVDKAGNIYIEDFGKANSMANPICGIRRVSPDGAISTIAAGAAICGTQLTPGIGFTVDPAGNLYIADQIAQSIWLVNSSGIIISKYSDLNATRLAMDDAGNLYAVGTDNRVYRVQPGRASPIDGLANVVALAAGPGNTLLVAQQALDQDPLHAESEIHEVTLSDRRPDPVRIDSVGRRRPLD